MDIDAFEAAHRAEWERLDTLVHRRRRLSGAEVDELVQLYQRAAAHLSAARSDGHDPALVARFVTTGFPAAAYRARWWWLASAAGSVALAVVVGWWVARSPGVQARLLPSDKARQLVNQEFRGYYSQYAASSFAAKVWTNNAWVAAEALISGILLGIPTVLVLIENAVNGGLDAGFMFAYGKGGLFFSLILPHGLLELSAVFLAAAAGLRLGWCIIDPGPRTRGTALAEEGRAAMTIALGLIGVLLVSGAIEAFVTPSPLPAWARIGIGAVAETAFLSYALVFGRRAVAAGRTADIDSPPDTLPIAA